MKIWPIILVMITLGCSAKQNQDAESAAGNAQTNQPFKEVVCFVYHRFGDSRYPSTNVSVTDFESHLKYLKHNNFKVLILSDALEELKSGDPTQKKLAVITIDDGYKSFFTHGLPLLNKYDFPATLFINTETVGGNDYMDWKQLAETAEKGIEIGNHTHSHAYFLNIDQSERIKRFKEEIELSQDLIQQNLGFKPEVFAYPYGEFDPAMKSAIESLGFIGAAAQNSGIMSSTADFYQIPRFPMSESYAKQFAEKAEMHAFKIIRSNATDFLLPQNAKQPLLELIMNTEEINPNRINCFIQGGSCTIKVLASQFNQATIQVKPNHDISKSRRTLYTITAQDSLGQWYWYSHLWINPSIP